MERNVEFETAPLKVNLFIYVSFLYLKLPAEKHKLSIWKLKKRSNDRMFTIKYRINMQKNIFVAAKRPIFYRTNCLN
jgi:hypothetical protein